MNGLDALVMAGAAADAGNAFDIVQAIAERRDASQLAMADHALSVPPDEGAEDKKLDEEFDEEDDDETETEESDDDDDDDDVKIATWKEQQPKMPCGCLANYGHGHESWCLDKCPVAKSYAKAVAKQEDGKQKKVEAEKARASIEERERRKAQAEAVFKAASAEVNAARAHMRNDPSPAALAANDKEVAKFTIKKEALYAKHRAFALDAIRKTEEREAEKDNAWHEKQRLHREATPGCQFGCGTLVPAALFQCVGCHASSCLLCQEEIIFESKLTPSNKASIRTLFLQRSDVTNSSIPMCVYCLMETRDKEFVIDDLGKHGVLEAEAQDGALPSSAPPVPMAVDGDEEEEEEVAEEADEEEEDDEEDNETLKAAEHDCASAAEIKRALELCKDSANFLAQEAPVMLMAIEADGKKGTEIEAQGDCCPGQANFEARVRVVMENVMAGATEADLADNAQRDEEPKHKAWVAVCEAEKARKAEKLRNTQGKRPSENELQGKPAKRITPTLVRPPHEADNHGHD
jgi:hypothetical protein